MRRYVERAALAAAVMLLGMGLGLAPTAQAQGSGEDRQRARQLYAEAQALFDSGQFAAAEQSFRAAYNLVPNPLVLLAIAAAQEEQDNIAGAADTLAEYLEAAPEAGDRDEVEARLAELRSRPATLSVETNPPGATVLVDGLDVGQVTPTDIDLETGTHPLRLQLQGYTTIEQSIEARPATHMHLELNLQPAGDPLGEEARPEPEPVAAEPPPVATGPEGPSTGVWILTAISGVGLVTGTVFGFLALSEQNSFDANPRSSTADRGEAFALAADIGFGVALTAGIAAVVLYIVQSSRADGEEEPASAAQGPSLRWTPWASRDGAGLSGGLTF
ncbi:MAG: PEGA domain-containing protein [Sandaracinaceae bacterium]